MTLSASEDNENKSLPFRTPVNRYMQNDNRWIHALRHFRKKRASLQKIIFDEEKTADYRASTNIFHPQFTQEKEKYLEAVFIVDISDSMQIWQEMIDEFFKSIRNYAIFKSITIYYIDTSLDSIVFSKTKQKTFKNHSLYLSSDTLLFILSDMCAPLWSNITFLDQFYQWQKKYPLAIIQMLPYSLWRATVLNYTKLSIFSGKKLFSKNEYLASRLKISEKNDKLMKIPLLNFDTLSFDAYGRVLTAKPKSRIDGAIFNLSKIKDRAVSKSDTILNSQERVRKFYESASEDAKKLAEYLSVVPLSFPIMKIVQQKLLPSSTQVHLSEVFMSPLIDKKAYQDIYRFYQSPDKQEDVRDILLKLLGTSRAIDAIITISDFVNTKEGAFDFLAFLNNPSSIKKSSDYNDIDREFARISAKILENMGGEYATLAKTLTEYIDEYEDIEEEEVIPKIPKSKRFQMGSKENDREKPIHEIVINYDFEIAQYPVTFDEYDLFCEDTGKKKPDDEGWGRGKRPVINVSWHDAKAYCEWLNKKLGLDEKTGYYRLPTEAEWEYSCRAGTTTKWSFGDDEKELTKYAWYNDNNDHKTHPVGEKEPNPWGLHDMHGNVWEWCEDWYDDDKDTKVLRGGSWISDVGITRSAFRSWSFPDNRDDGDGFRLLGTLPSELGDF